MYEIIKRVIASGQYDLTAMLTKIDTIWIQGNLTDGQHDELIELARGGADTSQSVDLLSKIADLDARVRALEAKDVETIDPDNPDDPNVDVAAIPEFVEGKWYYKDDTIKFKDAVYICIAPEGQACVWSPDAYPTFWQLVTSAEPEPAM